MTRHSDRPVPEKTILKRVQALFEDEPRINLHRHPIRLSFTGEDLILEGEAENIAAKKLALELAASVPGVGRIVDRLRVVPAERMSDAEIRDCVYRALLQEPVFYTCAISARVKGDRETLGESTAGPAGYIHVDIEDRVVILNGQVPSLSHKRLAGVLAWWVPGSQNAKSMAEFDAWYVFGVDKVINNLEVQP